MPPPLLIPQVGTNRYRVGQLGAAKPLTPIYEECGHTLLRRNAQVRGQGGKWEELNVAGGEITSRPSEECPCMHERDMGGKARGI